MRRADLVECDLPEQCLGLPPGLAEVDRLLDDPRFYEPFRPLFSPGGAGRRSRWGGSLRFCFRLGYEATCAEVADSLAWRRFCRIPLDAAVPHPSTLEQLKVEELRADTTVVEANVSYPTDCGLLARGCRRRRC